jgi:hypothetical protein
MKTSTNVPMNSAMYFSESDILLMSDTVTSQNLFNSWRTRASSVRYWGTLDRS